MGNPGSFQLLNNILKRPEREVFFRKKIQLEPHNCWLYLLEKKGFEAVSECSFSHIE
ncbi:hypothetical protein HNP38_003237 [Chryseobacterium defluvii]|uniref:Uncharacterized protein n=1 Tax=Chryseobacterium defluvii TaxID=160396 RepID=A0A840KEW7_9FLAO|nr:hypothetical protein [Chryseobacterium defluvii]